MMRKWFLRKLNPWPLFSWIALPAIVLGLGSALLHVNWLPGFHDAGTHTVVSPSVPLVICIVSLAGLVTARMYSEMKKARKLACTDDLTGLINRREFKRLVDGGISSAKHNKQKLALLALDLDRFKVINDSYGHEAGDAIIRMFSERIKSAVRRQDVVCRIAGDEFFIMLRNIRDEAQIAIVGDRILGLMKTPFHYGNRHIRTSVSIGSAMIAKDVPDAAAAMRMADFALLRSKERGRNCLVRFDPKMAETIRKQRVLELRLLNAVEEGKLSLRYHPIFDNVHGRVVAVEALIRWCDDELGDVAPCDFLPIAEELNIMEKIGSFVLEKACTEVAEIPDIRLAVNIGENHFMRHDFLCGVDSILSRTGFPSYRLEFEIPLALLEQHARDVRRKFDQLRERGISIALGDFGTGQSNPMYLEPFKLDSIKLDHSLIKRTACVKNGEQIVASMITLASAFCSRVTVEGIERADQLVRLRDNAGAELQGFYFSKPLTMTELSSKYSLVPAIQKQENTDTGIETEETLHTARKLSA